VGHVQPVYYNLRAVASNGISDFLVAGLSTIGLFEADYCNCFGGDSFIALTEIRADTVFENGRGK
jgi:hypothetical protein